VNPPERRRLVAAARAARGRAYAPYSRFRVGAALLGGSGRIYVGANVENCSYGLTNCAERVAIQSAVVAGERRFRALAVVADGPGAVRPCGACRQVLAEFAADLELLLAKSRGPVESQRLGELLPQAFGRGDLPRGRRRARRRGA
jgi:cytidine deaminase